ncbi:probable E3 ubiquitin-protein ligase ARI8 [Malus domestica]|uniref:probable E3 ubiquitin-protein ligase ARI8 n=1 Tax=Malus domestica TaxID=3750 RepID=UPI00049909CF
MDYSDQSVYDDEDTGFVEEDEDDDNEAANEFGNVQEDNIDTDDQPKQNNSLLKEDDVWQQPSILLPQFNWSISRLNDEWFANEDETREKVGLLRKPVVQFNAADLITCKICFDEFSYGCGSVLSAVCGHPYCRECWTRYVSTAINDGPPCLLTRCPEPSCKAAVGPDLIGVVTAKEDHERYKHFLLRSYIEGHRKIKWCPAPNCQYAVQFNADGSGNYDVSCLCSNSFCWNCTVEIHRPVDCATAGKWTAKNKDERLELKFIIEAWQQIIEARQILRWSYAYGYYIPEDELLKLKLFEHLLGHAVFSLERLTNATANYFDKLVRALESGLSEINPNYGNYWACDRCTCTYINQGSATTCAVCAGNMSEPEF